MFGGDKDMCTTNFIMEVCSILFKMQDARNFRYALIVE